ncbi:hypothetical protein WJX72_008329 [[Myrmecia] bisecta]|uniref:Uncharacterized protein n=1 Tax=[Myrmecia] bisecta TaxID=41462 RepID=A0AAW1Q4T6_9CHLO
MAVRPAAQCKQNPFVGAHRSILAAGWRRLQRTRAPCPRQQQAPQASFLGVGAPEALLVGVVALIVFGPKGLAEAAKSLGKTVRAFQPTLKELASVSSELKSTLEEQIGLDDIRQEFRQGSASSQPAAPSSAASSDSANGKVTTYPAADPNPAAEEQPQLRPLADGEPARIDPDIERKRAESATQAWQGEPPAHSPEGLTIAELEALLARKKAAQNSPGS